MCHKIWILINSDVCCFCLLRCCSNFVSFNSSTCFIVFWGALRELFGDFLVTGAKIIQVVTRDLAAISDASARRAESSSTSQSQTILHPSAPSPLLLIPPIANTTLTWPFHSRLWRAGWPAQPGIAKRNLHLDQRQAPRNWPWQAWAAVLLSEILPLTRAVNHCDTSALAPAHTGV